MITEALLRIFFYTVYVICGLLPESFYELPNWSLAALKFLRLGLGIFPTDVWQAVIANVVFWFMRQFVWGFIQWIYKKIPGIN